MAIIFMKATSCLGKRRTLLDVCVELIVHLPSDDVHIRFSDTYACNQQVAAAVATVAERPKSPKTAIIVNFRESIGVCFFVSLSVFFRSFA